MQNVTTESGEDEIDVAVLSSLLQFDESLRCGRPTTIDFSSLAPELREQLELGHSAIRELEAAIPRQDSVMPSWAPRKIGRFDIQSVLGAGGFAVVYLSYDSRLNRPVAVKVPRPHALIQPELRKRFAKEAQAAARLDHPNILPIYEAGEDGDLLYIVSALCEGPTLEDWLASRTCLPDPKLAAEIVRQLADALNYSHEHGVLHRDLKPGNVLLFPTDRLVETEFPFQARISDFGLAKVLDDPQLDIVSSQLMGTPRFMAPELLAGNTRTSSVASDIYYLGVILYTMLTGNAPFCSVSLAETMRQIASEDPISPDLINRSAGKDLVTVHSQLILRGAIWGLVCW